MLNSRLISVGIGLLLGAMLWGWINAERNNLVARTDSLAAQAHFANEKLMRDGFDKPEARERYERTAVMFHIRFRFPEGPGDDLEPFIGLWNEMARCEGATVAYEGEPREEKVGDGKPHPVRTVRIRGKTPEGEPVTIKVNWVQHQGNWYILAPEPEQWLSGSR